MTRTTSRRISNTVRAIALTFYGLLVVLPIYWMVITSFKTNPEIVNAQHITYFPETFTLENYRSLFRMLSYSTYLKNSIIVTLLSAIVIVILSIFGGYGLARFKFRGKGGVLIFFMLTQMIPCILVIIPLYIVFSKIGLINTRISLFIPNYSRTSI